MTEEPGILQSMDSQRVGVALETEQQQIPWLSSYIESFLYLQNTSQIDLDNIPTDYSTFRSLGKSVWQLSLPVLKYQSQKPESIWTCYVVSCIQLQNEHKSWGGGKQVAEA